MPADSSARVPGIALCLPPRNSTRTAGGRLLVLLVAIGAAPAACRHPDVRADDVSVEWRLTPAAPVVGRTTTAELTLRDGAGAMVSGATLQLDARMSHPGMAPISAPAVERRAGAYQADLQFTMRGDWLLLVTGTLPDGRRVERRLDITAAGPSE
jgi:hypothetical protein